MAVQIREAVPADYAEIAELNKNEMGYDYPPEETKKQLQSLLADEGHKVYVAISGTAIVGYVHAQDYNTLYTPPLKDIMGIAVASTNRSQGIGRMLLTAVEEWARKGGARGVRLVSGSARTGAHAFYAACGYQSTKDQKNFKKLFAETR